MNVLIVLGHPRADSLCGALADAYAEGARQAGATVRLIRLSALSFDPNVRTVSPRQQRLEPDLGEAQALIDWADHLVFAYPAWWGTMPALLKGFCDRVLTPGFAFAERDDGHGWIPLLAGKSADLLTTMDMPAWVYRWIYRRPGHNAMARSTLGFCGVRIARVRGYGPVKDSGAAQRARWLAQAAQDGRRLAAGAFTPRQRAVDKLGAWFSALRLQFYPMTWVAYTVGALAAAMPSGSFSHGAYWLGYGVLFLLEAAAVLSNEYFDFETDRANRHYGPFTGGSRVLVDGRLGFTEVRAGIGAVLLIALLASLALLAASPAGGATISVLLIAMLVLALGYTVPPLKLAYRGLGELDVGITHSLGVLLCGYVFQGSAWHDPLPWLLALPLFLAVLPSIILAGIPDYEADRRAAKCTLAVRMGPRGAILLAMGFTVLAALTAMAWLLFDVVAGAFGLAILLVIPHAVWLLALLHRYREQAGAPGRIDKLMVAALTYLIWFGAVPLWRLGQ